MQLLLDKVSERDAEVFSQFFQIVKFRLIIPIDPSVDCCLGCVDTLGYRITGHASFLHQTLQLFRCFSQYFTTFPTKCSGL